MNEVMEKKVLGFKQKDSCKYVIGEEGLAWEHYRIGTNKLVHVVSLQALKEYCKKNGKITDDRCMCYKEALDDLLLWTKKQGVEKT